MMVGYALDSPSGTYRFYNLRTNAVVQSNGVTSKEFLRYKVDSVSDFMNKPINAQDSTIINSNGND